MHNGNWFDPKQPTQQSPPDAKSYDGSMLVESSVAPPFHIGQVYEEAPARPMACRRCGGALFEVGLGDCLTAVRCAHCRWEQVVHDG